MRGGRTEPSTETRGSRQDAQKRRGNATAGHPERAKRAQEPRSGDEEAQQVRNRSNRPEPEHAKQSGIRQRRTRRQAPQRTGEPATGPGRKHNAREPKTGPRGATTTGKTTGLGHRQRQRQKSPHHGSNRLRKARQHSDHDPKQAAAAGQLSATEQHKPLNTTATVPVASAEVQHSHQYCCCQRISPARQADVFSSRRGESLSTPPHPPLVILYPTCKVYYRELRDPIVHQASAPSRKILRSPAIAE